MNIAGLGPFLPHDYISISTEASNWQSEGSEYYSATLKNAMIQESKDSDPMHRSKHHDMSISLENMESLLGEEEVVGIITLEDVMEELLQEDILDETDQYIDVHQNITIKLQHPRRGSTGSSKRASTSHQQRRSLDASRVRFSTPTTISPNFPSN